jgi:hypothetical protein
MEDNRDVVWGEIPRHIDVLLKQAKVEAPGIDIANIADIAGLNDVDDLRTTGE